MFDWGMTSKQLFRQALVSGAVASGLSTAMLALCGQIENRRPAGPINGPSQWLFGRHAARVRRPSLRHTLTGFLVHHAMATGWAFLHERAFGEHKAQSAIFEASRTCRVDRGRGEYRRLPAHPQTTCGPDSKHSCLASHCWPSTRHLLSASRWSLRSAAGRGYESSDAERDFDTGSYRPYESSG